MQSIDKESFLELKRKFYSSWDSLDRRDLILMVDYLLQEYYPENEKFRDFLEWKKENK